MKTRLYQRLAAALDSSEDERIAPRRLLHVSTTHA
ncbi:hypothetical protein M2271_008497 [Streptomyces sp. LBL]|nr:hypothetical protein [Streptomyces sp. LBL]